MTHCNYFKIILEMQGDFNIRKAINLINYINRLKVKCHDHLNRYRKSIWWHWIIYLRLKNLHTLGIKWSLLNLIKDTLKTSLETSNSTVNSLGTLFKIRTDARTSRDTHQHSEKTEMYGIKTGRQRNPSFEEDFS